MKTYIVTVDIKETHTYWVEANSESEAYEKMDSAELYEPESPVACNNGEPVSGVTYMYCEMWEKEVLEDVREAGE
tara:strand:+ start:248 stop:472 length:225 start_codon:yes stop_codon:yes gene_type:complete